MTSVGPDDLIVEEPVVPAPTLVQAMPGVVFGPQFLTLPDDLSFEAWSHLIGMLRTMEASVQFWLGDALRFGERKYGEYYAQAVQAETGYTASSLANIVYVAGQFDSSRRRENLSWSHHAEVAGFPPAQQDEWLDRAEAQQLSRNDLRAAIHGEDDDEFYTPGHIVRAVIDVLGAIDLDPAASERQPLPAAVHYTRQENGLIAPWTNRVFLNPPYSHIGHWIEKLCVLLLAPERSAITAAVTLVPAATDTAWFQRLWMADGVCFLHGRLTFGYPGSRQRPAMFPSVVAYFGPDPGRFHQLFTPLGTIVRRIVVVDGPRSTDDP